MPLRVKFNEEDENDRDKLAARLTDALRRFRMNGLERDEQRLIDDVARRPALGLKYFPNTNCFTPVAPINDAAASLESKEQNMETRTSDDYDVVTLMQISAGVRLYRCKFNDKATKTYVYKSTINFVPGDHAAVFANDSRIVVTVIGPVEEIDPGIDYKWIIGTANLSESEEILKTDDKVRRALSMSRALKEAEELRARIGSAKIVPDVLSIEAKNVE